MSEPQIADHPAQHRYELSVDGRLAARAEYRLEAGVISLIHTEVDPAYEGQGLASKLAAFVMQDIARRGLKAKLVCPFMAGYVKKHPEYEAIVAGG